MSYLAAAAIGLLCATSVTILILSLLAVSGRQSRQEEAYTARKGDRAG